MPKRRLTTYQNARTNTDANGVTWVDTEDALHLAERYVTPPASSYRRCPHGYDHPGWPHSCDGCWCEGERDRRDYGWDHDTSPQEE